MPYITVPQALLAQDTNGYSDQASEAKTAFHAKGQAFLKNLAKELGLKPGEFDVRSNLGGIAVSGEVTLHADHLYVQLGESCTARGIGMLFRGCDSRKDYCGHTNNWLTMAAFVGAEKQPQALVRLRRVHEAASPAAAC